MRRADHAIPVCLHGRGIVSSEASLDGPSKGNYESMARRRYQKPKPRKEGRQWVIYYWDDDFVDEERRRKKKRHVLGPATMGEREAEKVRDEFLRPLNQGLVNIGLVPPPSLKIMWNPCTGRSFCRRWQKARAIEA
jgi:hypothetical protein